MDTQNLKRLGLDKYLDNPDFSRDTFVATGTVDRVYI